MERNLTISLRAVNNRTVKPMSLCHAYKVLVSASQILAPERSVIQKPRAIKAMIKTAVSQWALGSTGVAREVEEKRTDDGRSGGCGLAVLLRDIRPELFADRHDLDDRCVRFVAEVPDLPSTSPRIRASAKSPGPAPIYEGEHG